MNTMMVTTAKAKNASPNSGSRCRSGRDAGWLRLGSAWALLAALFVFVLVPGTSAADVLTFQQGDGKGAPSDTDDAEIRETSTVFTKRVIASTDDAEQQTTSTFGMNLTSSDLELHDTGGAGGGYVGMRWTNVTIPQGATIDSAKIQFHVDEIAAGSSVALTVTFRGEDHDNAPTFTSTASNISNRTETTASVDWAIPTWVTVNDEGAAQLSAELKTIVQEIVDRTGWGSGNALVIMIKAWSGSGLRTAEAFDGESAAAPELQITYTVNLGTATSLNVDGSPHRHVVMKFPNIFGGGANQIPLGSTIDSATLTLQVSAITAGDPSVYQITESWVESQVIWADRSTGVSWTNPGADGTGSHKATAEGVFPMGSTGFQSLAVTTSVQNWSDGEANEGWVFIDNSTDDADVDSSENLTAANRPQLSVTYTPPPCPGGVVTTTADSGASSLRECINFANINPGTTIQFNIPGPGNRSAGADTWWGISPVTPLPTITAAGTVIDGTTQTTNQGDTNSRGPEIELDGLSAGIAANGLVIGATAAGSTIRGLVVQNFSYNGILLLGGSNLIAGNYLGISADGTTVAANNPAAVSYRGGIRVESSANTIGGTTAADRNVISGNGFAGIELFGAGATANVVYGNYIGVDATGTLDRGNTQEGIDLELGSSNIIGGPGAGQRNIISGNDSDGIEIDGGDSNVVQGNYIGTDFTGTVIISNGRDGIDINENGVDGATGTLIGGTGANEGNLIRGNGIYGIQVRGAPVINNSILGNQIYGNVQLGIDLNNDGITVNDAFDADSGPNDLLNFPVITSATASAGTVLVDFDLDVPTGDYRIEFFTNPSGADPSGNGEGEAFASSVNITHTGSGVESFSHSFAGSAGDILTANTTLCTTGTCSGFLSTSEFSTAFTVTPPVTFSARWPLDEISGVIAADVDAGNDGTYRNGVLLNQTAACTDTG
ncbi:MAG: DNRLRE domain-containing protein, partial [Proteobacteria bacterium]|nr:DNRLRE domain-containing protein [Pseudomonadota bacterium]